MAFGLVYSGLIWSGLVWSDRGTLSCSGSIYVAWLCVLQQNEGADLPCCGMLWHAV
jgi:hypothetical protein